MPLIGPVDWPPADDVATVVWLRIILVQSPTDDQVRDLRRDARWHRLRRQLLTHRQRGAGAITFVEPLVNTVAHYFFDKAWDSGRLTAPWTRKEASTPAPLRAGTAFATRA